MGNRLLFLAIMFFVSGSAMVSSIDSLSHTFKSIFYDIALTVLVVIGVVRFYKYLRVVRN